jgi:hypothetical protein
MNRIFNPILRIIALVAVTLFSQAQVPNNLSSYPTASATIFIDFDGQTVVSPYWNSGNPIYCQPAALTTVQMTRVFNQVSEDFRPFNINITTDSAVYFAAPLNRRMRIIVTPTSSWYGSAGGVAYVGSFTWGLEVPGFVFSTLLNNNSKMVSEAVSHETGHTLGLYHQSEYNSSCGFVREYFAGNGGSNEQISWAPIMGNSYSRNLTLWHNGPSSFGCNSLQNDLSIIGGPSNGFGFRTDDVGNTIASAATTIFNSNNFAINGFVNNTSDVDMFKVTLSQPGHLELNAIPYNISSNFASANIDMEVSLVNSNGDIIRTYNPSTEVLASVDSNLLAGDYYLQVRNVSNVYTTNYGMLGNYSMTGSFTAASTLPIQSMTLNGNVIKDKHELNWSILADEPVESIVIESSLDGRSFSTLQSLNGSYRKYAYQPEENTTIYYRLKATTASQLVYYSNIITLKETNVISRYSVVTNLVKDQVQINSKGNLNWKLIDMNGRMLQNGWMGAGSNRIDVSAYSYGMYLLQFSEGTTVLGTEKLVKN